MRRIGVVSAETEALPERWRVAVPLLLTAQWVLIVIYAVLLVLPGLGVTGWPRDVLVGNLVYAAPAVVIMARALLVPADRTWCLLLVCGMVSFLSGNLVFLWIERLGDPAVPVVGGPRLRGHLPVRRSPPCSCPYGPGWDGCGRASLSTRWSGRWPPPRCAAGSSRR